MTLYICSGEAEEWGFYRTIQHPGAESIRLRRTRHGYLTRAGAGTALYYLAQHLGTEP